MRKRKSFKELEFRDAFLFTAALQDAELCRLMLECILGFSIRKVVVHMEHTIIINPEYRGVRLDVYADDKNGTVYDVEMQTTDQQNLPKRSRLYQGQMDIAFLNPGDTFTSLPNSYVIFICNFDPFGRGLYRYTYQEFCKEDGQPLADGTCKIFLNTQGKNSAEVPSELVNFLAYVKNATLPVSNTDTFLQHLQATVSSLKHSRRMEEQYMLFGEMLDQERQEGRKEGLAQFTALIKAMTASGRQNEIDRLASDPEFLDAMLKEYHLA